LFLFSFTGQPGPRQFYCQTALIDHFLEARPHSVVNLYGAANDFIGQVVFFHNESKNNKTSSITHPDNSAILQILIQTIFSDILS